MLLSILFACAIAVGLYGLVDHKMHARPWRMFALALVPILLGTGLVSGFDTLDTLTRDAGRPVPGAGSIKSAFALLNAVGSSLGGALIGAAVSNRAALLHRRELGRIDEDIAYLRNILENFQSAPVEGAANLADERADRIDGLLELTKKLAALQRERSRLD